MSGMDKCKFCSDYTGFTPLNDTAEYSSIEIAINPNVKAIRGRHFPNGYNGTFKGQDIVEIKYCPMCGRKL